MQCASAIFSSVACPVLQYFSTLSHKGHDFRKKKLLNTKRVLIFSAPFVRNISHSTCKNHFSEIFSQTCISIHVKNQLFLLDSNKIWIFSIDFRKILKYKISGQSVRWQLMCSVRTDWWRTDRRADTTKLRVTFWNLRTRLKARFEILPTRNIIASQITRKRCRSLVLWTSVWRNFVMRQHNAGGRTRKREQYIKPCHKNL